MLQVMLQESFKGCEQCLKDDSECY